MTRQFFDSVSAAAAGRQPMDRIRFATLLKRKCVNDRFAFPALFAHATDLSGGGTVGGGHFVLGEVSCAGSVDAHGVGFSEGVLIGPEDPRLLRRRRSILPAHDRQGEQVPRDSG